MVALVDRISVDRIDLLTAKDFCRQWHYSDIFPPHCIVNLCYYDAIGLAGVALWGWGTRPKHTIKKLFPSLDTGDYWELARLCLRDDWATPRFGKAATAAAIWSANTCEYRDRVMLISLCRRIVWATLGCTPAATSRLPQVCLKA